MLRVQVFSATVITLAAVCVAAYGDDRPTGAETAHFSSTSRVYGEWRIQIKPDKGPEYSRLIEQSGLPLFRAAGGRMVGWWSTLIGNLYEHVTIWEYDDMAAFERAIGFLSKTPAFARFVTVRDPLLAGEESRFLRLARGASGPSLPEPAPFVVHERHRVPLSRKDAYLAYMTSHGLGVLKANGFRPVGPWIVDVGRWSEVTYLFPFNTLAERERLIAKLSANANAGTFRTKMGEFVEEITTRMLVPTPFSVKPSEPAVSPKSTLLPRRQRIAPGIHAAGFADRYHSANCGWVALGAETLLIDLPRGMPMTEYLALVTTSTGKPVRTLALTNIQDGDVAIIHSLIEKGVARILASPATRTRLLVASGSVGSANVHALAHRTSIGDAGVSVDFLPFDQVASLAGAAIWVPGQAVLFAGPLIVNGPRVPLADSNTEEWIAILRHLDGLAPTSVIPGFGSWGGPELLVRQRRFLSELRRQVSYHICQGRPHELLRDDISLPADCFAWTPYGHPLTEDLEHVYKELTVPIAPFHGREPHPSDSRPHALVLIGDQPHEPGHLEDGLRPVFDATGVIPHFAVDVRALSAENLSKVQLLVILRDGLMRPKRDDQTNFIWITPEQERAVVAFVEGGGGFLNLHNAMGLYPANGPYLQLVGGRYIGHGPLERFQVEVVDASHPITHGVESFFVADEQHTPPYDERRVHLLLRNRSDAGQTAAAGWVREPGRGRLCHLANGHTLEALAHPMYQKLMCNAVRWCLRVEDNGTIPGSQKPLGGPSTSRTQ